MWCLPAQTYHPPLRFSCMGRTPSNGEGGGGGLGWCLSACKSSPRKAAAQGWRAQTNMQHLCAQSAFMRSECLFLP